MRIIDGGDVAWSAVAFGNHNPVNLDYFKNQLNIVTNNLTDYAKGFYSEVNNIVDRFTNSDAMRSVRLALKGAASLFSNEIIKSLYDIEDFQTASMTMQRWVMANPVVRKSFHEQKCDGYSDTYVDLEPNRIGDKHYDYRRVMNGVAQFDEDGNEYFKLYFEDLLKEDKELTLSEKSDILHSWDIIEMFMRANKLDPTSQYGANL